MAKQSKSSETHPFLLFLIATLLLAGGWLMKPFPLFLLFGFVPLFKLTDRVSDKKPFWDQFELILLALGLFYFTAFQFAGSGLITAIIQAIALTIPFIAYGFARQTLGTRVAKFTILLFWLSVEYVLIKLSWRHQVVFLADGFELHQKWFGWTYFTGYLGVSLWILLSNLLVYFSYFRHSKIEWVWVVMALLCILFPVIASFLISHEGIFRKDMITFYQTDSSSNEVYFKRGEWVARTSAWVSALILLLSLVKYKTSEK